MKLAIIGASGNTGTKLVLESLKRGHPMVAVCRDSSVEKLDEFADHNGFTMVTAPVVSDEATLTQVLIGCDAVVASNGGLAHVYLRKRRASWSEVPAFDRDVLPIGKAFWDAHQTGRYAPELSGSLWGVLVRNVEAEGWYASYQALTPDGNTLSLNEWFQGTGYGHGEDKYRIFADPVHRLNNLVSPFVGDLLLVSNYGAGYYCRYGINGVFIYPRAQFVGKYDSSNYHPNFCYPVIGFFPVFQLFCQAISIYFKTL